jgi:hypothetical protein
VVKNNLSFVMIGIIIMSVLPIAISWLRSRLVRRPAQ